MNDKLKDVIDRARGPLSMVDFAAKCGISYSTLYRWLRGEQKTSVQSDVIRKIAENADPDSYVTEDELRIATLYSIDSTEVRERILSGHTEEELYFDTLLRIYASLYHEGHRLKTVYDDKKLMEYVSLLDSKYKYIYKICPCFDDIGRYEYEEFDPAWKNRLFYEVANYILEEDKDAYYTIILVVGTKREFEEAFNYLQECPPSVVPFNVYIYEYEGGRFESVIWTR